MTSEEIAAKPASASRVTLAIITEPGQSNPNGTIHGGVILKLVDECGAIAALRHAGKGQITTAAIDSMTFLGPVYVGERVEILAEVTYVGRSSIETRIEVFAEPIETARKRKVGVGYGLYVALDQVELRPRPVPPLLIETEADQTAHKAAQARQAVRLAHRAEALGGLGIRGQPETQSRGAAWYSISGGAAGEEGVPGSSNLGTDWSLYVDSEGAALVARDDEPELHEDRPVPEISSSSTAPLSPFLNSTMPLPSERPTSGRRLPKRRTASPISIVISNQPTLGNMQSTPVKQHRRFYGSKSTELCQSHATIKRLGGVFLSAVHRLIDVFLDPGDAFFELGDALAERSHHAGEGGFRRSRGKPRPRNHLRAANGWKKGERQHEKSP